MYYKIFGILLTFTACLFVYLQHQNQQCLSRPLPRFFLHIGCLLAVIALILLIVQLPVLVAILIWLATMTAVWSFTPLIVLFKSIDT